MMRQFHSWRRDVFLWVIVACVQSVVLLFVAMLFYPGGTAMDASTSGYLLFRNFFSDLGLTQSHGGQPNTVSAVLFMIAMTSGGGGLILFFIAFRQLFTRSARSKLLSRSGSTFGVLSGLCFICAGFMPGDLFLEVHMRFALWAFGLLPAAVILYIIAMLSEKQYPNHLALVFVGYGILLVVYWLLIAQGASRDSPGRMIILVTGQKLVGYASLINIFIQAQGARRIVQAANGPRTD